MEAFATTKEQMAFQGLQYRRSLNYITENPNWTKNILFGFICGLSQMFIPLIGQLVWLGYQFEVVEDLHTRKGSHYVDFDFDNFGDYLIRGAWIALVALLVSIVLLPILLIVIGLGVAAVVAVVTNVGGDEGAIAAIAMIIFMIPVFLLFICLTWVATLPFILRTGLSQNMGTGLSFAFAKDFLSKVGKEAFMAVVFSMAIGILGGIIGTLMCIIGQYATMAYVSLSQSHLLNQLYELYLARGGEKIPLKPRSGPVVA